MAVCKHLNQIDVVKPSGTGCKECLDQGYFESLPEIMQQIGKEAPATR